MENWVPKQNEIVTLKANDIRLACWHRSVARVGVLMDGKVHLGIVGYGWTHVTEDEIVIRETANGLPDCYGSK